MPRLRSFFFFLSLSFFGVSGAATSAAGASAGTSSGAPVGTSCTVCSVMAESPKTISSAACSVDQACGVEARSAALHDRRLVRQHAHELHIVCGSHERVVTEALLEHGVRGVRAPEPAEHVCII